MTYADLDRDSYIDAVLSFIPEDVPDRDDIAREIESVIAERSAEGESLDSILEQLGEPLALAESFLEDVDMETASTTLRVLAKVIDMGIPYAIFLWVLFSVVLKSMLLGQSWSFLLLIAVPIGIFLYPVLAEWHFGTTLGKSIFGLRVVRESGAKISIGQALLRSLPILGQALWFIDAVFAFFGERHQRAFERLSHTRTINSRS